MNSRSATLNRFVLILQAPVTFLTSSQSSQIPDIFVYQQTHPEFRQKMLDKDELTPIVGDSKEKDENPVPVDYENDGEFYSKAQSYWSTVDATVDGMLGGFSEISTKELQSSKAFLNELFKARPIPERRHALDCGAGIGRVTKGLLMPLFDKVDMVEQDENFCETAKTYVGDTGKLGEIHNCGLQDFDFEPEKYDVIWSQWVLGHLKDNDLVDFFKRAQLGLKRHGIIVIKENFTNGDDIEVDEQDSSVTRPLSWTKGLIKRAGLRVFKEKRQTAMPDGLYPIHMLALKPVRNSSK